MFWLMILTLWMTVTGGFAVFGCVQKKCANSSIPVRSSKKSVPQVLNATNKTPNPQSVRHKTAGINAKEDKNTKSLFHGTTESKQLVSKSKNLTLGGQPAFGNTNEIDSPLSNHKIAKEAKNEEKETIGSERSHKDRSKREQKRKPKPGSTLPSNTASKPKHVGRMPNKDGYDDLNPNPHNNSEDGVNKSTFKENKDGGYDNLDPNPNETQNLVNPEDGAVIGASKPTAQKAVKVASKPKTLEKPTKSKRSERPKAAKSASKVITVDPTQEQSKHPPQ
ncbi:hypothetical protein M3Y94_01140600 [Aphelenchoides besseyi]|nr:hypothetical protein M3Y94_01140600 [Aphelenchoides besseyi]KAI6227860.1 hypothetical protein M3Y95_00561100 [Aphelenchoides besseyi]